MKNFSYLIAFLLIISSNMLIGQVVEEKKTVEKLTNTVVHVYYFHNTRRCATCQAVETVTEETLNESYPGEIKSGKITFQSLNIEDDENRALAKSLNISGQALLLVKGDKIKELTNEAFMYARSNPEKLKIEIQQFIDSN
jgi:hypothetical protein